MKAMAAWEGNNVITATNNRFGFGCKHDMRIGCMVMSGAGVIGNGIEGDAKCKASPGAPATTLCVRGKQVEPLLLSHFYISFLSLPFLLSRFSYPLFSSLTLSSLTISFLTLYSLAVSYLTVSSLNR